MRQFCGNMLKMKSEGQGRLMESADKPGQSLSKSVWLCQGTEKMRNVAAHASQKKKVKLI